MDWTIKALESEDDVDAILAIEERSFTNPWTRQMYLAEMENTGVSFFYLAQAPAVAGGDVTGFCAVWRVADELHINNLAVAPEWRRQGVASALLGFVLAEGVRTGARRATLEVRRSNESALRLYEQFGFTVVGIRRGYYTKPVEDALVLWREDLRRGAPRRS